ncbi:MAG: type II secretion system F family protein [Acetatifactor sp.]
MKVFIFLFLFLGFFLLFHEMKTIERIAVTLKRTRQEMNAASRQRSLADRQKLLRLQERNSLWNTLEQQLQYSGIRARFPELTPERWIVLHMLFGGGIALLALFAGDMRRMIVCVVLWMTAESCVLKLLRRRNLRRTENGLAKLLDFLGNYSIVSGDVTGILGQISRYMEEPIKSALDACYYDAAVTGDTAMALIVMAERLEHPKFKELARNMEISVRYCADFSALVSSSRRSLREYLHTAGERRGMYREAVINLVLLVILSAVMLLAVSRLTGVSFTTILAGGEA